ncbi:MAG: DnaJ domain-containing protein [Alphaproteobacteria bacterium]|nr:DnaJ domain-containing protein [Alphaproteobacteria bacterium]
MGWLAFGVCSSIGLILLMRWLSVTSPSQAKRVLAWTLVGIVVLAAIFLALTGRLAWAGAALSALAPWAMRAMRFHAIWREVRRHFGKPGEAPPPPPRPGQNRMSSDEAHALLGLKQGASPEEIQIAYKRLMQKVHPDAGGNSALAAKINEARDVLMGK